MEISARFLTLLGHQLAQFSDRPDLRSLVVYLALPGGDGKPGLIPVGHWPRDDRILPAVDEDRSLQLPSAERRWLPLRQDRLLLGALRVETAQLPWPPSLSVRLQAVAHCLTEARCFDLDNQRLQGQLEGQDRDLRLLVHQLRNPLAALRTFGQLLKRRLERDPENRSLVDGLLEEERQLNRYVDAIDSLGSRLELDSVSAEPHPLLLPPSLSSGQAQPLQERLDPLLQRAAATASLQDRDWFGPGWRPDWSGDSGAVAEILANLLENAFRYSPKGSAVGLHCSQPASQNDSQSGRLRLTVWDGGPPIGLNEREAIFERGVRGATSEGLSGTGVGLALARQLARSLGGELQLIQPPQAVAADLPGEGNAFCLSLPSDQPAR